MTNRERLNVLFASASDKEVARHFAKDDNCGLCMFKLGSRDCEKHTCYDGILKWLKTDLSADITIQNYKPNKSESEVN